MSGSRFVLLGLEAAGSPWPAALSGLLASRDPDDEYLPCDGPADLLARLATGRRFSAVVVDHRASGLDRELVRRILAADCPVLVVGGAADAERILGLGASVHVPDPDTGEEVDQDALAVALADHARPIGPVDDLRFGPRITDRCTGAWTGRLVAVTGPGGSGTSTVARALAAGLVDDPRLRGEVLLVDACLQADQADLHGLDEPATDLRAATQAHRAGDPDGPALRSLLVDPPGRRYRLLPGIRRRSDWPAIGGPTLSAALRNLRDHHLATVVDVDPYVDLAPVHQPVGPATPGEPARIVVELADLVVVVHHAGAPRRPADRVAADLAEAGLPADRLVRLQLGHTGRIDRRERRRGRERRRSGDPGTAPTPAADLLLAEPAGDPRTAADLAGRILAVLDRLPGRPSADDVPVTTGSLGTDGTS